ncbi:hypothetical protein PsorP6_004883 [Peronosclerospora sorghi]|uniref:Uncharacterized protein n=1 Tax=Peronosclerospora sorghi TaxID=230839 RepID=A0ACC0W7V6_9STRA|nr:hypothetical protein PsorP6_004883 [Peronosclerospora sorghi]
MARDLLESVFVHQIHVNIVRFRAQIARITKSHDTSGMASQRHAHFAFAIRWFVHTIPRLSDYSQLMEFRTKTYPSLPDGLGLRIVLPRAGDLRYRSRIPNLFAQCLYIHADPRRRFWYARFQLKRKFIVLTTQGDVYVKTSVTAFTLADLPNKNVLSIPRMVPGDLVKVLDFAQCSRIEGQHWEIVLVRWSSGMETWLPLEVVNFFAPNLLQEFYVNSINSWAFHSRVKQENLVGFRTEVELWLSHPEFQEFYKLLRQKIANTSMLQSQPQSVLASAPAHVNPEHLVSSVPLLNSPIPFVPRARQPTGPQTMSPSEILIHEFEQRRLAKERQEELERARQIEPVNLELQQQQWARNQAKQLENETRLQHEQKRQKARENLQKRQKDYEQRLRAQKAKEELLEMERKEQERRNRETDRDDLRRTRMQNKPDKAKSCQESRTSPPHRTKTDNSHVNKVSAKNSDDDYIPSDASSESNARDASVNHNIGDDIQPRKRRRKRLLYSQVELEDEDDYELPDLSQPPRYRHRRIVDPSDCQDDCNSGQQRKVSDISDQFNVSGINSSSLKNVDHAHHSTCDTDKDDDHPQLPVETVPIAPNVCDAASRSWEAHFIDDENDDSDDDSDDDLTFSNTSGDIRCPCGITTAGKYRGQWLQCCNKECGFLEHADCVGFLTKFDNQPPNYLCSRCHPESYQARCVKASQRTMDWLFQCCESRNRKQLMELLKNDAVAINLPLDSKNTLYENRTLAMQAARNGLIECLHYLLVERRVDIFATDLRSWNALHHAVHGESIACCRFLLKQNRKLLLHPDSRGCTPFHYMLQSPKVNKLSIHCMQGDTALIGTKDLDSNFPIHYACQVVNRYTFKICQIIFAARSSMLFEKSNDGLNPLMILCKATAAAITNSKRKKTDKTAEVGKSAKDIISLMLDIDVFGDCLNQTAPNGWFPLHFAAASGSYDLITLMCQFGRFDVNFSAEGSRQTALHVAAQENCSLSVRALLLEGVDVVAKDNDERIPVLSTRSVSCVRELMNYKLAQQLSILQQMLGNYQLRGLVCQWQRIVASDPTCFDIINDWCQTDIAQIERFEELLLSNPFLLRLDNKIDYVRKKVIPSIKSIPSAKGKPCSDTHLRGQRKLKFVFSRESGCFWKQFIKMGKALEPENFRMPIIFSITPSDTDSQGTDDNIELVLIRLAAGLRKEVSGLLTRESCCNLDDICLSYSKPELSVKLLEFYLLGELVAHFVLFAVSLSGIFDFNPGFLRCISCKGKYQLAEDRLWKTAGSSFVLGFEAVLPATLELFHAEDLRVLFHGPDHKFNALEIDWGTAVNWKICKEGENGTNSALVWLPRLVTELVREDQQLLLLFMTETYQLINDRFFRSEGEVGRINIASFPETDGGPDHDAMYPIMEYNTDTLRLPSYSCYEAFKRGLLTVIRHADRAFLPD